MHSFSGELFSALIHNGVCVLIGQALSIYGNHSDIMLKKVTDLAMMSIFTLQVAHDMPIVTQITFAVRAMNPCIK